MKWLIDSIVRLIRAVNQISTRKWSFAIAFALAFLATVAFLAKLDLLPEPRPASEAAAPSRTVAQATEIVPAPSLVELPTKIEIQKIKLTTPIVNPTTTDIPSLDKALLLGAVRYPTSAKLGEVGNVVLFAHSSYLPVVGNPAYKAFNEIQKLVAGDTVTVYSAGTAYTYRVRSVERANSLSTAIPLQTGSRVLTLSTCDSFGAKTDRFVVTADFVESHPVSASAEMG